MEREQAIQIIRQNAPELKTLGLAHLRLFGSVARDEATPESDIDLLADFDQSRPVSLVTIGSLESRLSDFLGTPVDLSSPEWMREPARLRALQEAVIVF